MIWLAVVLGLLAGVVGGLAGRWLAERWLRHSTTATPVVEKPDVGQGRPDAVGDFRVTRQQSGLTVVLYQGIDPISAKAAFQRDIPTGSVVEFWHGTTLRGRREV